MATQRKLSKRFLEGLKNHKLTLKDIEDSKYVYCGGDTGSHRNYWLNKTRGKGVVRPSKKTHCVCGHDIIYNFYIADENFENIMVLGSTCIKRFIGTQRTCNVCGVAHKNRIVDRCNECREGLCDTCDKPINACYSKCYRCKYRKK